MSEPSPQPGLGRKLAAVALGSALAIWLLVLDVLMSVVLTFGLGEMFPRLFDWENLAARFLMLLAAGFLAILAVVLRLCGRRGLAHPAVRRFCGWLTVGVFSLVVLYYSEERWRGRRAYAALERRVGATGEQLGLAGVIPPPVPDDQNLALAPVFASNQLQTVTLHRSRMIGDRIPKSDPATGLPANWRQNWTQQRSVDLAAWQQYFRYPYRTYRFDPQTKRSTAIPAEPDFPTAPQPQTPAADVLLALSRYGPALSQLEAAASQRPVARFPIHYERGFFAQNNAANQHRVFLPGVSQVLRLRAVAELASGKSDAALLDVALMLRLADSIRLEPFVQSHFARENILMDSLQPVWEGLANQRWSEVQLERLQEHFARLDLLADAVNAMRAETAMNMELGNLALAILAGNDPRPNQEPYDVQDLVWYGLFRIFYPSGWAYLDQVGIYRVYEERALPIIDLQERRVFPTKSNLGRAIVNCSVDPMYAVFVAPRFQEFFHATPREFAFLQTATDEAAVACALERYRRAHEEFPERLESLVPRFIRRLPRDVITGQPLTYRRTQDGQFVLYSVGWNGLDDGGQPSSPRTDWRGRVLEFPNLDSGDWVWSYPPRH